MTNRCPGRMLAGAVMLLASMMADAGTPWRRAMESSVSPRATVTAVPPSQPHLALAGLAGAGAAASAPTVALGRGELAEPPLPRPACAGGASLSTRAAGAACVCAIDPVASGLLVAAKGPSFNRDNSPLQAATPMVISASAATRGQDRACNNSTRPHIPTHHTQYIH